MCARPSGCHHLTTVPMTTAISKKIKGFASALSEVDARRFWLWVLRLFVLPPSTDKPFVMPVAQRKFVELVAKELKVENVHRLNDWLRGLFVLPGARANDMLESIAGYKELRLVALKLGGEQVLIPLAFVCLFVYLLMLGQSDTHQTRQMLTGWGGLLVLAVLHRLPMFRLAPWRFLFILLAGFIALRYVLWRTSESMFFTGPADFVAMAALYAAEIYALTIHFLGMFVNLWPLTGRPTLVSPGSATPPIVDVFIPTYNESDEIVRITVIAATQMDYPKDRLRIHICDDGGTVNKRSQPNTMKEAWERHYRLRAMAEELGVNYITRETNQYAKAGNLNHALNHTSGDLILVLDCDHVPTRDMLQHTVGYFLSDPKLFLVQTPHFFINPTPVEKNLAGVGNPNSENDMFYRSIHPSLDFWNASYFCGSAAVLRRSHLMEVGGLRGETITEDAETAFLLHSKGYNSVYVEHPMVCGLSPESYDDYVLQRTRWAQGMVQMFIMNNPLFAPGLTLPQRLCYFNSCLFWFFGLARFTYFIAPAMFLVFELKIFHASGGQIVAFILPFVLSTFILMDFFYGKARQPFFSEIYESVQSMFLIPAVLSVIVNPRKPSFKVTPKGNKQAVEFLNPLATSFLIIILINVLALVIATYKWYYNPILREVLVVTGGWCLYNLYLSLVSLGAFWERRQIRQFHRINVREDINVSFPRLNLSAKAKLTDISLTGIRFEVNVPFALVERELAVIEAPRSRSTVDPDLKYRFEARVMRSVARGGTYSCGAEFSLDKKNYAEAVSFVYGDSDRWLELWDKRSGSGGTTKMLFHFFFMGLKGTMASVPLLVAQVAGILFRIIKKRANTALQAVAINPAPSKT